MVSDVQNLSCVLIRALDADNEKGGVLN